MVLWDSNSMMAFWGYTFGVCFEAANHPPQKKKESLGNQKTVKVPPFYDPGCCKVQPLNAEGRLDWF